MESCDTGCQRVILPCHHSNQGPGVSELTISRTSPLNFRDQDFCSVLDFKMFLAVPMMLHYGYDLNEFICNTCFFCKLQNGKRLLAVLAGFAST